MKTTINEKSFSLKTIGVAFLKEVETPKEITLIPEERIILIDKKTKTLRTFVRLKGNGTSMLIQVKLWEFIAVNQCSKVTCKYLKLTNDKNIYNYLELLNMEPAELDFKPTTDLLADTNKYLPEEYIENYCEPTKCVISLSRPCENVFQGVAALNFKGSLIQAYVPLENLIINKASTLYYKKISLNNEEYLCDLTVK